MKVYITCGNYALSSYMKVFSSRELAEEYTKKLSKEHQDRRNIEYGTIIEKEIDENKEDSMGTGEQVLE